MSVKDNLDQVFSHYVRQLHASHAGRVRCSTCVVSRHWSEMTCGHFMKRGFLMLRWVVENAAPQCGVCNGHEEAQRPARIEDKMAKWLDARYGEGTAARMREIFGQATEGQGSMSEDEMRLLLRAFREKMRAEGMALPGDCVPLP